MKNLVKSAINSRFLGIQTIENATKEKRLPFLEQSFYFFESNYLLNIMLSPM
ncbi:hypothetical protein [uncultured Kordia sp.]|uniref:hypothetical protein n=1 Tax=uncultured Kordia sp. TaxID=507699 RepID=UPI00263634B1|nr:hypothetical protein [uncultured Kordia sp.]